jgi:predicted nucleic acid-binding protein
LQLFWDASALAKRYLREKGADTVAALFAVAAAHQMVGTLLGYTETVSAIMRHRNRGLIQLKTWAAAKTLLRLEVVENPAFSLLTIDDAALFASVAFIERYNLNATDAAILTVFLRYLDALLPGDRKGLLIASDQRLITAAEAEGLKTLNPEIVSPGDVPSILAAV